MTLKIGIICLIDDPFDPPGAGRFGGGHVFMYELGKCLLRENHDVTYITLKNDEYKYEFETLGPRCRIHRLNIGPHNYKSTEELVEFIDEFYLGAKEFVSAKDFDVIHAQYWLSGDVARKLKQDDSLLFLYHPLSFGRSKRPDKSQWDGNARKRDHIETQVLQACDHIIVGTLDEVTKVKKYYPEINHDKCTYFPHWVDGDIFCPRPEPHDIYIRRQARYLR